jgi:hypothetical protein
MTHLSDDPLPALLHGKQSSMALLHLSEGCLLLSG